MKKLTIIIAIVLLFGCSSNKKDIQPVTKEKDHYLIDFSKATKVDYEINPAIPDIQNSAIDEIDIGRQTILAEGSIWQIYSEVTEVDFPMSLSHDYYIKQINDSTITPIRVYSKKTYIDSGLFGSRYYSFQNDIFLSLETHENRDIFNRIYLWNHETSTLDLFKEKATYLSSTENSHYYILLPNYKELTDNYFKLIQENKTTSQTKEIGIVNTFTSLDIGDKTIVEAIVDGSVGFIQIDPNDSIESYKLLDENQSNESSKKASVPFPNEALPIRYQLFTTDQYLVFHNWNCNEFYFLDIMTKELFVSTIDLEYDQLFGSHGKLKVLPKTK